MLTMVAAGRVTMPAMGGREDDLRAQLAELEATTQEVRAALEAQEDYLPQLRTVARLIARCDAIREELAGIRDDLVRARTQLPKGAVTVDEVAKAAGFKTRRSVYILDRPKETD